MLYSIDRLQEKKVVMQKLECVRTDIHTVIKEENISEDTQPTSSDVYTVNIKEEPILYESVIHNIIKKDVALVKSESTSDGSTLVEEEFIHQGPVTDSSGVNVVIKEEGSYTHIDAAVKTEVFDEASGSKQLKTEDFCHSMQTVKLEEDNISYQLVKFWPVVKLERCDRLIQRDIIEGQLPSNDITKTTSIIESTEYCISEEVPSSISSATLVTLQQKSMVKTKKRAKCDKCSKTFPNLITLKTHKLNHSDFKKCIRKYVCDICNKAFTFSFNLRTHKLIHSDFKKYVCDICNKAFTFSFNLKAHKLIHSDFKKYVCDICNKAFTFSFNLKEHKLIHSDFKKYVCDICGKGFVRLRDLRAHKVIHSGIKNHVCDICNKAFGTLSNLIQHKLVHSNIKKHICDICNKAFARLYDLKKHKGTHSGIKSHSCDICNKAFTTSFSLKTHKLIHSGIKNHICVICNKAFTDSSTLRKHKVIHSGIKELECDYCKKKFSLKHNLYSHILNVHSKAE